METLHVLLTNEDIQKLIDILKDPSTSDLIAYDTETTSLENDAEIVGFSLAFDDSLNIAYYIVTAYWDRENKKLIRLDNRNKVTELLLVLKDRRLIMHNAIVDCKWTNVNYGVQLIDSLYIDTMPLAHLLDENRSVGLKEIAAWEFGESAKKEQEEMRASVVSNGGIWEQTYDKKKDIWKDKKGGNKEMYKADYMILGKYGAKDALLTLKIAYLYIPRLFEEELDKFFFEESMPLFRGPTYQLNTVGLKVDVDLMKKTEQDLRIECTKLHGEIMTDIYPYVKDLYPGGLNKKGVPDPKKQFNIGSSQQIAWLLFVKLGNNWKKLTKSGRSYAKDMMGRIPYTESQKREFMRICEAAGVKPQGYIQCDKATLTDLSAKYVWVKKLLEFKKLEKLLTTYVVGMQKFIRYGIIYPSFSQTGTTGGRYASFAPNFQNLPRKDKRIKKFIISRPGKVFVGADYCQLEPRVFASFANDQRLIDCFKQGYDFYSVIGIPVFGRYDVTPYKEGDPNAFGVKYPNERDLAKGVALSATYGTGAYKLSDLLRDDKGKNLSPERCQEIIDDYFRSYPSVKKLQLESHEIVKETGIAKNLFGRPRRIPEAKFIKKLGNVKVEDLDYEYRTLLNLSINHRIQSTAASIVNRAAIAFEAKRKELAKENSIWNQVSMVMQIHDEIVLEAPEAIAEEVRVMLKYYMENTVELPNVKLEAEPKIARNLADLK